MVNVEAESVGACHVVGTTGGHPLCSHGVCFPCKNSAILMPAGKA